MGIRNILHDVWNRKLTEPLFISFFILVIKPTRSERRKVSCSKFGNLSRHLDRRLACPFRGNLATIICL
jgi:hypothetical protein